MKKWLVIGMFLNVLTASSQTLVGEVFDAQSGEPLIGATVYIPLISVGSVTNELGEFSIGELPSGVFSLEVSFLGYEKKIFPEIWIRPDRTTNLSVSLNRSSENLEEIVVFDRINHVAPGKLTITEEQVNRFAATYYDPARMLATSPDVAVTNDQNNQISVRGISPDYNNWRLEGAEIVNPNHLSNAGTLSDQPRASGGGVNIISAQMMDQVNFEYGTFGAALGNGVGGIFNVGLKTGSDQFQHTGQASFIGFDLASEGPITESGITYATNYRYSFTGLLANMGVDFGGESIGFQDLSFTVNIPTSKSGDLKLFGLGGLNSNLFEGQDFEDSETEKDRSDIDYTGNMGAVGVTWGDVLFGFKTKNTVVYSLNSARRLENTEDQLDRPSDRVMAFERNRLLSISNSLSSITRGIRWTAGLLSNFYFYKFRSVYRLERFKFKSNQNEYLFRPYLTINRALGKALDLELGMTSLWNVSDNMTLDPRLKITYNKTENEEWTFGVGRYSQLLNPYNRLYYNPFLVVERITNSEIDYGFINSWRFSLAHTYSDDDATITMEGFHYLFLNPRINSNEKGTASTTGVSLRINRSFSNDFYLRVGGSLFLSLVYPEAVQEVVQNVYGQGFNTSFAGGRDWLLTGNRVLSFNLRSIYQGGLRFPEQQVSGGEIIPEYQTTDYLRFDLRLQYRKTGKRQQTSWSLDVQNLLNRENEAYRYFDSFTQEVETQTQLGLLPVLTYRVDF